MENFTKKLLVLALIIATFSLIGCGNDDYYNDDYDSYYYGDYDDYDSYDYDYGDDYYDDYGYDDSYDSYDSYDDYDCAELVYLDSYPYASRTLTGTNDCGQYVTVYVTDYYDDISGYGTDYSGNFVEFIYW